MLFENNLRQVEGNSSAASDLFYGGRLKDHESTKLTHRPLAQAALEWLNQKFNLQLTSLSLVIDDSNSLCLQDNQSKSCHNPHNRVTSLEIVRSFANVKGWRPEHITILTQYRAQADTYRQEIRGLDIEGVAIDAKEIGVHTVDSFQGNGNHLIIFDAVDAKLRGLGFVTNKSRLNVATSRARDCFIMVIDMTIAPNLEGYLHISQNEEEANEQEDSIESINPYGGGKHLKSLLEHYHNRCAEHEMEIDDTKVPSPLESVEKIIEILSPEFTTNVSQKFKSRKSRFATIARRRVTVQRAA